MMGSPHENGRTVPLVQDSKGRRVKDRLHNIDTAMAWIKEELVSAERGEGVGGGGGGGGGMGDDIVFRGLSVSRGVMPGPCGWVSTLSR